MCKIDSNNQLGFLISAIDAVYHEASLKLHLSDSALQVLYALYLNGSKCLLSDITKMSGISRKTIHSAIKKLEADDIIRIEQYNERNKCIVLTDKGIDIADEKIAPLVRIEHEIIFSWKSEERETYIKLMNRYYEELKDKVRNEL